MGGGADLNGYDAAGLRAYVDGVRRDPAKAERNPALTATWVGGSRARVELGGKVVHIGGDDEYSAMQILLAALAACDVEVVTTHATLLGVPIRALHIEARGHFTVQRLFGLSEAPAPGYDDISYVIHLDAPTATPQQRGLLMEMCERASPVGDSLGRAIPLRLEFTTG